MSASSSGGAYWMPVFTGMTGKGHERGMDCRVKPGKDEGEGVRF
ncbi:hypothetical protein [Stappia sediminis]|nr:hypothetical protein [Stappia sediminis]